MRVPQTAIARLEREGNPRFSTLREYARGIDAEIVLVPRRQLPVLRALLGPRAEDGEEPYLIPEDGD